MSKRLILGSASPRRSWLLKYLEVPFSVETADVDEDIITVQEPGENVTQRALLKAEFLLEELPVDTYLLTADTTVAIDGQMLNKPVDYAEAHEMLSRLCNRVHQVYTAVVFASEQAVLSQHVSVTDVVMRPYTDEEIDAYIKTGDPFDKAGGYAIQHATFRPVERFIGCYSSVVGLPVCEVGEMLVHAGLNANKDRLNELIASPTGNCRCHLKFV